MVSNNVERWSTLIVVAIMCLFVMREQGLNKKKKKTEQIYSEMKKILLSIEWDNL